VATFVRKLEEKRSGTLLSQYLSKSGLMVNVISIELPGSPSLLYLSFFIVKHHALAVL